MKSHVLQTKGWGKALAIEGLSRVLTAGLFGVWVAGCASSSVPPPATSAAVEESAAPAPAAAEAIGEEPVCVDEQDRKVECLSDADCCDGFVCGKDPDLNPRTNYCLYGG